MRQRLIQLAKTPEVVLPIGVLAMAIVLLVVAIASLRPDSTVAAALIAAVAAGYGTVISLTVTRFFERQKEAALRLLELERDARAKKVPEYEKFIAFLMTMFFAEKLGKKPMTSQQMIQGFVEWTKPLLIWGSDEVVLQWGRLRVDPPQGGGVEGLFRLEDLLIELRRDVGYPETKVRRGDILRLWVNDIDQYLGNSEVGGQDA